MMKSWSEEDRPLKKDAREYALDGMGHRNHTLWLPGDKCWCVKRAIDKKIVDENGAFIFVEKDSRVVPAIRDFIQSREWKNEPILFEDDLTKLKLPWSLDYAFLDFLGTFDKETSIWISQNLSLSEGAALCITHTYGWRYNLLLYKMKSVFEELDLYSEFKNKLHCYDDLIALPLAMIQSMLNKYSFKICWPCKYQDSVRSMLLFRLENFHHLHGTNGWPDFFSLLERSSNMSATSAKKAWATRRAVEKEKALKRHQAALKAWATRRKLVHT